MGGAMSMMPVIKGAFRQQAADTTQWADTIDWTVRCEWLQVASVVTRNLQVLTFNCYLASFIVVVIAFSCNSKLANCQLWFQLTSQKCAIVH